MENQTCIKESRKRSLAKTGSSAGTGAFLYGLVAHSVTASHSQSLALLFLGAAEGIVKTAAAYQYERWFSGLSHGRSMSGNPAHDHPLRSAFKTAGWFVLSTGADAALAFIATHDRTKAIDFMVFRGAGRLALSYGLERAWARTHWGMVAQSDRTREIEAPSIPPSNQPALSQELGFD